jgi:hypothetical protein
MTDQSTQSTPTPTPPSTSSLVLPGQATESLQVAAPAIRRPKKLAAIYGGTPFQYRTLNEPKYRKHIDEIIYLPDLPGVDLSQYDAVMIPDRMHPDRLMEGQERITRYLDQGGTVIAFGEQPAPVLPGIDWEYRPTNFWWWLDPNARSGLVLTQPKHSLFNYLSIEDCTWHQHGVFTPPEGAETLVSMEDGGVVMYVDKVSSPGTMIVTCLDPISHFGSYFMPATERFLNGFLPWVSAELLGKP